MNKVRLGILGMGNMGSGHLENILCGRCPEVEVTAVCDLNPARLEFAIGRLAAKRGENPDTVYTDIATFADGDEMFASGLIDAVIIAIPHYGHPDYAIKAMKAGLHVMCEKPAGVYTLQVKEMMAEADKHPELKFGMMFNQRTNHIYRKVKEIMDSGELGAIKRTSWIITNWYRPQAYYDSGAWRATWSGEGGGVLLNQCPHNLDLWQWICGMPKTIDVKMHFGKWHDIEVEDDVTAYVEYENGATGTFITTTGDAPGTNRLEIVCDGGTIITDGGSITLIKLETPESEFSATNTVAFAAPKTQRVPVETDGQNPQHVGVLNAFAGAILRDEPLVADGREGINGLTISNAMHLSAWTGEAVTLPWTRSSSATCSSSASRPPAARKASRPCSPLLRERIILDVTTQTALQIGVYRAGVSPLHPTRTLLQKGSGLPKTFEKVLSNMAFKRFWRSKNLRDICHRQIRPERSEEVFKKVLGGCRAEPCKPKFEGHRIITS